MLHGEIKVNDRVIGTWKAVRRSHDLRDANDYDCHMTYENNRGYPMEGAWILYNHEFGAGAAVLAARVLCEGMNHLKVKPMGLDEEAVKVVSKLLGQGS